MPYLIYEAAQGPNGFNYHIWSTKHDGTMDKLKCACHSRECAEELLDLYSDTERVRLDQISVGKSFSYKDQLYMVAAEQTGCSADGVVRVMEYTTGKFLKWAESTKVIPVNVEVRIV